MPNYEKYIENIRRELKEYIVENNIKSLVLGLSGGADSTLVALLAQPVCNELDVPLIGISIPIDSNKPGEIYRAHDVGRMTCDMFSEQDLSKLYLVTALSFIADEVEPLTKKDRIRRGNIKARLRMICLYNYAALHEGMVLSTDNYTEYLLGFWTLHGDVGDYGMIQELWKTEVYGMLEHIRNYKTKGESDYNTIDAVIGADATDGLGVTATDLDQILPGWEGSSKDGYAEVDILLKSAYHQVYEVHKFDGSDAGQVYTSNHVLERMLATRFKRLNPLNIPREIITMT